jgi:molybdate transport system substrate-binding protein
VLPAIDSLVISARISPAGAWEACLSYFCRVLLAAAAFFLSTPARAQPPTLVFAAASLTDALQEIGKTYEGEGRGRVVFSFAGSMILARQIAASSGADLFIAADSESMDYLQQRGLIMNATRSNLLTNRLVLVAPRDSNVSLAVVPGFALARALGDGRLAIANPETVPAGRYARAALTSLGVWDSVATRLAQGEDVRQTLAFVARGETPLGIVYATDARAEPRVRAVADFPADTHPPIVYPAALTMEGRPGGGNFLTYLKGQAARRIFAGAGFGVAGR